MHAASKMYGKDMTTVVYWKEMMERAGFVNVHEDVYKVRHPVLYPSFDSSKVLTNYRRSLKAHGPKTRNSKKSAATIKSTCSRRWGRIATRYSRACWAGSGLRSRRWSQACAMSCATCRITCTRRYILCMGRDRFRRLDTCPISRQHNTGINNDILMK